MTQDLQDKAINIKGKQYILVSDRVLYFNDTYPKGSIATELLSKPEDNRIVMKATVYPDGLEGRFFEGHSQAVIGEGMVNKTAALENAETSAVGRALGMMGIGVIESIASADEMHKAISYEKVNPIIEPKVLSPQMQTLIDNVAKGKETPMASVKFPMKVAGEKCPDCGGIYVTSKIGKVFCSNKCWLPENAHFRQQKEVVDQSVNIADDLPIF